MNHPNSLANLKRDAGPGRPKGSGPKIAEATKKAFVEVLEVLDPVELLHDWALNRPELFKDMWKAMLPKNIEIDGNLKHQVERVERVIVSASDRNGGSFKAANSFE